MPTINSKSNNSRCYHRLRGLFHHEKPSYVDMTYSYQYMLRFRMYKYSFNSLYSSNYLARLPITLPPFVPTLLTSRWYVYISTFKIETHKLVYIYIHIYIYC